MNSDTKLDRKQTKCIIVQWAQDVEQLRHLATTSSTEIADERKDISELKMKLETVEQALNSCLNGSTTSATKQEILDQMYDLLMALTQFQAK